MSLLSGGAQGEEGDSSLEVIGTPDMVPEVISFHSLQNDAAVLRKRYALAGIRGTAGVRLRQVRRLWQIVPPCWQADRRPRARDPAAGSVSRLLPIRALAKWFLVGMPRGDFLRQWFSGSYFRLLNSSHLSCFCRCRRADFFSAMTLATVARSCRRRSHSRFIPTASLKRL